MREDIKCNLIKELSNCKNSVDIITAFCKIGALDFIDNKISGDVKNKRLLVRFLLSDLLSGATDIDIYEYAKSKGWRLFVRLDLHAKTYLFDKKRCIIGSANLTTSGLDLHHHGNYEIACLNDIDQDSNEQIDNLFKTSIELNDIIFGCMKAQYDAAIVSTVVSNAWDNELVELMRTDKLIFFPDDFPPVKDYQSLIGFEVGFLGLSNDWKVDDLRNQLIISKSFLWLKDLVSINGGELFFGSAVSELHNSFIVSPIPYRKEIKRLFSNLLEWIIALDINELIIDKPRHSQRIRLRD